MMIVHNHYNMSKYISCLIRTFTKVVQFINSFHLLVLHTTIKKMYFTKNMNNFFFPKDRDFRGFWICYSVKNLLSNDTKFKFNSFWASPFYGNIVDLLDYNVVLKHNCYRIVLYLILSPTGWCGFLIILEWACRAKFIKTISNIENYWIIVCYDVKLCQLCKLNIR